MDAVGRKSTPSDQTRALTVSNAELKAANERQSNCQDLWIRVL